MSALVTAVFAFILVKYAFAFLGWLTEERSDKVYRRHLDNLYDSLDKSSMYDLAFLIAARIRSRFRLAKPKIFVFAALFLIFFVFVTNYVALLVSLSIMAKGNPNFAFSQRSIPEIAWSLFRELGFTGSQQMTWLLGGTSLTSVLALFLSRKSLLTTRRSYTASQLALVITKQAGVLLVAAALTVGFLFLSVVLYDKSSNTETQQYLYTQTVRMLYLGEQPIAFVVLINTLSSSFPSALFLLLYLFLVALKLLPDFVRKVLVRVVFLITTDSKPVFGQIGSSFGALAALTTALITFLRK
jgi:hypothetical protein